MFAASPTQVYEETAGLTVGDVVTRTKKVCLDACMGQGGSRVYAHAQPHSSNDGEFGWPACR
jgi:hypothetical protein